jgi:hypothetical protein
MVVQQAEALSARALSSSRRHGEIDFHLAAAEGENLQNLLALEAVLAPLIKKVDIEKREDRSAMTDNRNKKNKLFRCRFRPAARSWMTGSPRNR